MPQSVRLSDLDGDGKLDLVASTNENAVSVLLGNGDGSFGPKSVYGTGGGPREIAIGDINGDARPDLAVATVHKHAAVILLNRAGDGPTAVLLSRFDATWTGDHIDVRWQFGRGSNVSNTVLERGNAETGPWASMMGESAGEAGELLVDRDVVPGQQYFYRLNVVLGDGQTLTFGPVAAAGAATVVDFDLLSVSPSPSNGVARVTFTTPRPAAVRLDVMDVLGRRVTSLLDETLPAGRHEAVWDARGSERVPAGLYFVHFEWPGGATVRRLALTR
jgi:hypothetical protein